MGKRTFNFGNIHVKRGDMRMDISLRRFDIRFQRAQYYLDGQVMTDMVPRMPFNTGVFINQTRAKSASLQGSGKVYAAFGVQGRFLYEGKVMVDELTGSPWARKGAKKIVTEKDLQYSNPRAVPHWFEEVKRAHGKDWIKEVKQIAGGK